MNYPMEKYRYYVHDLPDGGKEVIALSTYAGCTVKGKARCHPSDTFDLETGKRLAALRCALKIAHRRVKRADECLTVAYDEVQRKVNHYEKMRDYYTDSVDAFAAAQNELNDCINEILHG